MSDAKRVGVYLRVSTTEQSTDLQAAEINRYLAARGWGQVKVYEDKATGTNANRPMLKALLADAKARNLDAIVVWKLDRFARSLRDLVTMIQELSELGVEFISLKDNIDMSTASGRLMLHIIGSFAEFEASIIKERVRAGVATARARGTRMGRPSTIDAVRVRHLHAEGWSLGRIARFIGASKAGVHKVLSQIPATKPVTIRDIA
jgi:DNA invertase Pin-like site-specific DNA recombinase